MKVTIIAIVIGAVWTVTEKLVQRLEDLEIRGWMETIQTTVLLRWVGILRRVLETWGDLLSNEQPSANPNVKNSKRVNDYNIKKNKKKKKKNIFFWGIYLVGSLGS